MDLENIDFDNLIEYLRNSHTSYLSESLCMYFFNLSLSELYEKDSKCPELSELVVVLCSFFNIEPKVIAHFVCTGQLMEVSVVLYDKKMTKFKKAMKDMLKNSPFYNKSRI
jgi:hypothetical protein